MFDAAAAAAIDEHQADSAEQFVATAAEPPPGTPDVEAATTTLLVVDARVADYQSLLANLPGNVVVRVISAGESGLDAITEALAGTGAVDSVQIISHGSSGSLALGRDTLDSSMLTSHSTQVQGWATQLTAQADILLYGCDVGAGAGGTALLTQLAALTGADIAASTDATGSATLGGNWLLEQQTGHIDSTLVIDSAALAHYDGLLVAPSVSTSAASISVIEPSSLNSPGASSATLSGWSIGDDALDSPIVTVDVVTDAAKGTLSNPGGAMSGTVSAIAGGFRYIGTPENAQTWTNQLVFTAANVELGAIAATTTITVSVTDSELIPLNDSASLGVTITPSNDPVVLADGALAANEVGNTTITAATLAAIDPEVTAGIQNATQIVYRLTAQPAYGYLTLSGTQLGVNSVFTQQQVISGNLVYVHTASGAEQNTNDSFAVSVNDGATPQASSDTAIVTISITPANQAPTVNASGSIYEGQPRNATSSGVAQSIVGNFITATGGGDPGDATLNVKITSLPTHGTLYYNGTATINGFTLAINRALTASDFAGSGFVIAYASRSGLSYANDGLDPAPDDGFNIEVTDGGGGLGPASALTTTASVTLNIRPVNDDPLWESGSTLAATVTANGPNGVPDGGGDDFRVTLTAAMLQATDVDSADTAISFVLTELPIDGNLLLGNAPLLLGATFTMDDVSSGRVHYVQTAVNIGGSNPSDSFQFQIRDNALALRWDAAGEDFQRTGGVYTGANLADPLSTFTFNLSLAISPDPLISDAGTGSSPLTPAPTSTLSTDYVGLPPVTGVAIDTLSEGGTVVLTSAMLSYTASGVPASQIVYSIKSFDGVAIGWNGQLQKFSGGTWVSMSPYATFTQDDINNSRVQYIHDGGEDFASRVTLQVSAGGVSAGTALVADNVQFNFYITPINDVPTTTGSTGTLISEGSTLAITTSHLSFSDPDDATSESWLENDPTIPDHYQTNYALNNGVFTGNPLQFRVTALPTHGKLQYDTTGGGAWVDITATEVTNSTLYIADSITGAAGTTRIRYVHDGLEDRTDTFQVISRDRWGTESATGTVNINISNTNDAPEIAANPTLADPSAVGRAPNAIGGLAANEPLTVIQEGGFAQITSAMLQAYDPDSSAQQVQYRVTTAPSHGRMAYSDNVGGPFTTIGVGSSFTQQQIAGGKIYYVNDGAEPSSAGYSATPDDSFTFTLADGDKEQPGNQLWIYVNNTNDAPTVTGPSGPIRIDSAIAANNPVAGFTLDDVDLATLAPTETDFLQVTVRLLDKDGNAFKASDYSDYSGVTIGYAAGAGATPDADKDGSNDFLTLRGKKVEVNNALLGLTVTFADDRDQIYMIQVIADDRVRDLVSGNLVGGPTANGGALNQAPSVPGVPTAIPTLEYDWYNDAVPASNPNIAAKSVTLWASSVNDLQTITEPGPQTPFEDTAFTFSLANTNQIQIADSESTAFGLDVQLTLSVASGTLTVGSQAGVTVTGSGSGTVTLTGTATAIQARLDAGFSYTGNAQFNDTDTLTVTLAENLAAVGGDVIAGSVKNPDVIRTVSLDLVPVNDLPTVSAGAGILVVSGNIAVPVDGVVIGDANDLPGVQAGEIDFIQVTVRLVDAALNPVSMADVIFGYANSDATVDLNYNGIADALVLRGTLKDVQDALKSGGLTVTFTGDQNASPRVQIIADDRLRNLITGALLDDANGGAVNQLSGLPDIPTGDGFNPLTSAYVLIGNNTAAATRTLNISSTNDAPVNVLPVLPSITEDATTAVSGLSIADADDFGASLTVTLTPTNATLSFSSVTAGVVRTGSGTTASPFQLVGSKTDINTELAKLRATATTDLQGNAGIVSIAMQTTDTALAGSLGGNQTDTDRLDIAVTSVNDQPTSTSNVTLGTFVEDVADPAGTVINTLTFGYSDATDNQTGNSNAITGVAGNNTLTPFSYLAIVGDTNYVAAQGTWQISNGAGGWININDTGYSTASALIFESSRQVRFVAAANFHGTPGTLTVRLADDSVNLLGKLSANSTDRFDLNLVVNGGLGVSGAWSDTDRAIGTRVDNVNDRPFGSASVLASTTEDISNPAGALVSALVFGFHDTTDDQTGITGGAYAATLFGGIAIVGNAADSATQGVWQYNDNAGSGWISIGSAGSAPSNTAALLLPTSTSLRFLPVANYNGAPGALSTYVSDVGIVFSASTNISGTLGATSQWSDVVALSTGVTAQNDTPTLTGTVVANPAVTENASTASGLSIDPVNLLSSSGSLADLDLGTTAGLTAGTFGAGVITVTTTDGVAGDELFVNGGLLAGINFVAGGTGATPLSITLTNSATLAQVETILAALQYRSTSDNPTANNTDTTRSYTIVVSDGNNAQPGTAGGPTALAATTINGTITITATQDAPQVDLNGGVGGTNNTVTWTEAANDTHLAVKIAASGALSDVDNTNLTQMRLTVAGLNDGNSEQLNIGGTDFLLGTNYNNVTVGAFKISYDSTTGIFTIVPSGSDLTRDLTSFQTLLQNITYVNGTDNPTAGARSFSVQITDAGLDNSGTVAANNLLSSNTPVSTLTVAPANDQPRLSALDAVSLHENSIQTTPGWLDQSITLVDIDSPSYAGGTITISGLVTADSVALPLSATPALGNIQWTGVNGGNVDYHDGSNWVTVGTASGGNASNFVVTLNASATAAITQRIVENLTFRTTSDAPAPTRTLTYAVNDGSGVGSVLGATLGVTIIRDNDLPAMSSTILGGSYTERDATALQFVGGAISVSDLDQPASFNGGSLTVHLDSYVTGDTLSVLNQGTGAGQIGVSGASLSYGGVAFATTSGGSGSDLVVTFTSTTATPAAVQALLARLRFGNPSNDNPTVDKTDPSREFTITLNDGSNIFDATADDTTAKTAQLTGTIDILPLANPPVVGAGNASFTEGGSTVTLSPTLTLSDSDDTQATGATVRISAGLQTAYDSLAVAGTAIGATISGTAIQVVSYDAGTGLLTLSGTDLLTNYQLALRSVTFSNSSEDPAGNSLTGSRSITWSVTDANANAIGGVGAAGATGSSTSTVTLYPVDDAPSVSGVDATSSSMHIQGGAAVVIDSDATLGDFELAARDNWAGAQLTLARSVLASSDDLFGGSGNLLLSAGNAVLSGTTIGSYTQAGGTLTLRFNANASTARVNETLQSLTYRNTQTTAGSLAYSSVSLRVSIDDQNTDTTGSGTAGSAPGAQQQGSGGHQSAYSDITVNINRLPVANADTAAVSEGLATSDVTTAAGDLTPVSTSGGNVLDTDQDGDPLSVQGVAAGNVGGIQAANIGSDLVGSYGKINVAADGSYSYTLDNTLASVQGLAVGETTSDVFTYTINDGRGGLSTSTVSVTLTGTNDAPAVAIVDVTGSITEALTLSDTGSISFTDVDLADRPTASQVTLSITALQADGSTALPLSLAQQNAIAAAFSVAGAGGNTNNGTINWSYAITEANLDFLATGETVTAIFTVTVADGHGGSDQRDVTITIHGSNDAPANTLPGAQNTPEDTALAISGLSLADVDNGSLSTTLSLPAGTGTLTVTPGSGATISGDGTATVLISGTTAQINAALSTVTYTPTADYNASGSINLTIATSDGALSDTDTLAITVAPVADIVNDTASTSEDTAVTTSVLGNDSFEGSPQITAVTQGTYGSVTISGGGSTVTYTPDANYHGPDSYTYTVTSPAGITETATVNVTVDSVTDLLAADDSFSTNEDSVLNASVAGNDSTTSGGSLSFAKASDPAHGSVTFNADGSFSYTPAANYHGPDSFTYTVTDATSGETLTQTVHLTVTPVADLLAADDSFSSSEDSVLNASVTGNDSTTSGGSLSFAKISDPAHGSVTFNADGSFSYTPVADYNGADSFTYTVTDASSGEALTQTVHLTVTPLADIASDTASTSEDSAVTTSVLGNDSFEGSPLITAVTQGAHGSVSTNGSTVTYTPNANYHGPDSYTYTVTSPAGVVETASVSVTITPVTDLLAADDSFSTNEDSVLNASVAGNDSTSSGGSLSFAKVSDPAHGSVTLNADGTFTYTPMADYNGADSFTYTVTDVSSGEALTQTVHLTISPVADIVNDTVSTSEDTALTTSVLGNDSFEGAPLVTAVTQGTYGSVTISGGGSTVTYTPDANYHGPDSYTYTVTSPAGITETATVNVAVLPVNDLVAADDSFSTNEDSVLNASVAGNDSTTSGGSLSFVKASDAAHGSVTFNADGSFSYTPAANYHGPDSFTYTVTDATTGETLTQTVHLTVSPVADLLAADDSFSSGEDSVLNASVTGNDSTSSGGSLSFAKISDPAHGSVTFNADGTFIYTPVADYNGADSFTYTVTDATSGEALTQSVRLTVTPVADIASDTASTNEDSPVTTNVLGNDSFEGSPLVTAVTQGAHGAVSISGGTVTYTPDANYHGPDSYTYTVTSPAGVSETATVSVTVNSVNDVPVANDDSGHSPDGRPLTIKVLSNDTDVDGDLLTITRIAGVPVVPGNSVSIPSGTITLNPDGTLTFSPNPSAQGNVVFSYEISDGHGGTATANVKLSVIPMDHVVAPTTTLPPAWSPPRPADLAREPSVFHDGDVFNGIVRLPSPFQPALFVSKAVEGFQQERSETDPRGFSDPDAVRYGEMESRSIGANLGFDVALFVQHAVRASQAEGAFLDNVVDGRTVRINLSSDRLIPTPELSQANAGYVAPEPASNEGRETQAEASPAPAPQGQRIDAGDRPVQPQRAAASFSEQLRNAESRTQIARRGMLHPLRAPSSP